MSSFICTSEPLMVGKEYQYREADDDNVIPVKLVKDKSDENYYNLTFELLYPDEKPDWFEVNKKNRFTIKMATGDYYYPGMPRIWDEDEY